MQQILPKIALFLTTLAMISVFLPYGSVLLINTDQSISTEIKNGYALIYPGLSVIILVIATYLMSVPKRKRDLTGSLIISLINLLLIGIVYQQLREGAAFSSENLSSEVGYYILQYSSIGIAIISISRVINLKAFFTAKREYEEIITEEYQKLP
ncbi:MAG: hypothetical protein ACI865_000176 [Flavobacteriaceae bacterium]|jgi:hypothetical protein